MIRESDFIFSPEQFFNREYVLAEIARKFGLNVSDIKDYRVLRRSIDARKSPKYNARIQFLLKGERFIKDSKIPDFKDVSKASEVIIVGSGPAGYFAALQCLVKGFKPIVLERGKAIEDRKHDIAKLNREQIINTESNYAFGEGGAGTYSDGKLYTRSKKRGDVNEVLELLHFFGADEDILVDAHPHIGTDKLPGIMRSIRLKIIECGGEVHFDSRVTKVVVEENIVKSVVCEDGKEFVSNCVVMATGHSARDVYQFLSEEGVFIQEKGFAMGVRVEHPQELIDSIQYKRKERGEFLPAASYNLVKQINGRGVYSFCMCPGGTIVCASTDKGQIVVNGMSNSKRNSPFANSGIVVELRPEDFSAYSQKKSQSGLEFQKMLENMAFQNAAAGYKAPAQRLNDFVKGTISNSLPDSSYHPGLVNSPLHFWLPEIISTRLRAAFKEFNKQMSGFLTNEAIVVGVESRTSSPVQIVRDRDNFQAIGIKGLFPIGEGAGYAGGIVSSAVDGIQAVNKIALL